MKNKNGGIISIVCVAAFAAGIFTGYIRSKVNVEDERVTVENVQAAANEEESVPKVEIAAKTEYYQVKSADDYIFLYEIFDNNTKKELERAEINMVVLPQSDIEQLKEGISFTEKEEALMVMESLIS